MLKILLGFILLALIRSQLFMEPTFDQINSDQTTNSISNFQEAVTCACDITLNTCDYFCCCDTECSSTLITTWQQTEGVCLQEDVRKYHEKSYPICEDWRKDPQSNQIYINQISTIQCLTDRNVPYEGQFYRQNLVITRPDDSSLDSSKKHFSDSFRTVTQISTITSSYTVGSNLLYKLTTESLFRTLKLLGPDSFGQCSNRIPIKIGEDLDTECVRVLDLTAGAGCTSSLKDDIKTYFSGLIINGAEPTARLTASTLTYANDLVTTVVNTNECQNLLTGITAEITLQEFAITKVAITFAHDTTARAEDATGYYSYVFSTVIKFLPVSNVTETAKYPFSGTPGYRKGYELLIGEYTADTTNPQLFYIKRFTEGYRIRIADADGNCLTDPAQIVTGINGQKISFGSNFSTSCLVSIASETDFNTACQTTSIHQNYLIFNNYFKPSTTRVGIFGVANIHKLADWVTMAESTSLQTGTATCSLTRAHRKIIIYYTDAGAEGNFQTYVLKVESHYLTNDVWEWDTSVTGAQKFSLNLHVEFVEVPVAEISPSSDTASSSIGNWFSDFFVLFESN